MKSATMNPAAQALGYENVEYVLRDAQGNIKPMFQDYRHTQWLIKKGYLSPLWINSGVAQLLSPFLGFWSASKKVRNGVPTVGKALIAGRLNGSGSPAAATYIAVGTGTTAFAAGDTTLQTEITDSGLARVNGTPSLVTTTTTNDTAQVTTTYTVSGTKAVTESGLLNASSSGTLAARQTFSAINVVSGDSLAITWKIAIS